MDTPPTAIIDACDLYSAPVRDLIVRLAQAGLIQALWTAEIHDEWIHNVLKNNPKLTRDRLERTRSLIDGAVRDCLVTGYADLVDSLTLPDPDDRHVLTAAIRGGADVIVTLNLGDFPADVLTTYGVKARHPDELIAHLIDVAPVVVTTAAKHQREGLKNPPRTWTNSSRPWSSRGLYGRSPFSASFRSRFERGQIRSRHSGKRSGRIAGQRFCPIQ